MMTSARAPMAYHITRLPVSGASSAFTNGSFTVVLISNFFEFLEADGGDGAIARVS